MTNDNFRKLIRNLRIDKELQDLCDKKGLNKLLAKKIAFRISMNKTNLEISQELGVHLKTTERYRKVLGSLEESQFKQILNQPLIMDLRSIK